MADLAMHPCDTPSPEALAVLLAMATRLGANRPGATMYEGIRLSVVLTAATDRHGYLSNDAAALQREVLRYAPSVDRAITRGEYALIVRQAVRRAQ